MINIDGDWKGDIFSGTGNKKGEEKIPDGLFVRGKVTPRKDSGRKEEDSQRENSETGEAKDNENFIGKNRQEGIETSAKKVGLVNNERCEFTLHNPDEVGVSGCERCEITIYEPKKLVVDGCERCTFTIYTSDPEQIDFNGGTNNDRTTFTYLDPEDDSEWDWPPEDDDDKEDEILSATNGQVMIGGKSSNSHVISGDGYSVDTSDLGEEFPIGTEVLLMNRVGSTFRDGSYDGMNLAGLWELQYDEQSGRPIRRNEKFVYKRLE